jgi:multicomponent Na+:H+ antiporter subunit A
MPLLLSAATLALGGVLFALRGTAQRMLGDADAFLTDLPERAYQAILFGLNRVALLQTRALQSGYLRRYLLIILATTTILAAYALARTQSFQAVMGERPEVQEWTVAIIIVAGAVAAVTSSSRLAAVAALGVVGYGVALIYVFFGAPDLALTQLLVETITVILFVLVFYHLPRFTKVSTTGTRVRDAAISLTVGGLMTLLVLATTSSPHARHVSEALVENSLAAHGRNVVNVILVDFRAIDTLGEITVLAVAGIGVYALLKLRPAGEKPWPP